MIIELGHYALILGFCLACLQSVIPLVGAHRANTLWIQLAHPLALGQWFFILISFLCLVHAFVQNDFSVAYVAHNSNSQLPLQYRISAVWGAHEGSLLLWTLILAGWTAAVSLFSRRLPQDMIARVIAVMGMISVGFLLFLLETSNPFIRYLPDSPIDGRDLNPLLQDFGLIVHPPLLYMGYVGFSVAFAFAIAALIGGKLDVTWARWSRPWTTVAWAFLTIGIALGSWWAYYELGWGGWWFWDPVENASFMPWLIGTALIHSLAVTEKRGAFKRWTLLLAIFAFSLSLLGTFLVRSGVLTSVHAFATDPERGAFILKFLGIVVGGSLILYACRTTKIDEGGKFEFLSKEVFLLLNNVILTVAAASVLLGTLYPLLLDALQLGKISVGPPYFNVIFLPLMGLLAITLCFGVVANWKKNNQSQLLAKLRMPFIAATVASLLWAWLLLPTLSALALIGLLLALSIVFTLVVDLKNKTQHSAKFSEGVTRLSLSYWGMQAAHLGFAVSIIGVTLTGLFSTEKDVRLVPGESITIEGYQFIFRTIENMTGPNYNGVKATFQVDSNNKTVAMLYPEKRYYPVQNNTMTEAAIDPGLWRDLYVSLGEPLEENAWAVRVYHKPFIRWIWLGALLMALGGALAISDKRYRLKAKERSKEHSKTGVKPAKEQLA